MFGEANTTFKIMEPSISRLFHELVNLGSTLGTGSEELPAYAFLEDRTTGIYLEDLDKIGFSTAGVKRMDINNDRVYINMTTESVSPSTGCLVLEGGMGINGDLFISGSFDIGGSVSFSNILLDDGSAGSPSLSFTLDTNTGIYRPSADNIAFSNAGTESLKVDSSHTLTIKNTSGTTFNTISANSFNFQPVANSTSTFLFKNSAGNNLLSGNTTDNYVQIGTSSLVDAGLRVYNTQEHLRLIDSEEEWTIGIEDGGFYVKLTSSGEYIVAITQYDGGAIDFGRDVQIGLNADANLNIFTDERHIVLTSTNNDNDEWYVEILDGNFTITEDSTGDNPIIIEQDGSDILFQRDTKINNANLYMTNGIFILESYSKSALPTTSLTGGMIFVTDDVGGSIVAFSDGTNWRRMTDRAIIS